MANALNRHEKLPPHAFTAAIVRRGYRCLEWGVRADNHRAKKFYRSLGARVGNARVASLIGRALTTLVARR